MLVRVQPFTDGDKQGKSYWMWCPGCEDAHRITDAWGFDGNLESPTFSPSILVHSHKTLNSKGEIVDSYTCHSFVSGGKWEFLADSTHDLAGQTVPMVDLPDYFKASGV